MVIDFRIPRNKIYYIITISTSWNAARTLCEFIMLHLLCDTVYAQMTVIRPADMDALQNALDNNNVSVISFHCPWLWQQKTYIIKCSLILWPCQVSLFFTETPTNPFLRCIDVEHVSNMCHSKGALLCIDSTFASPINQKALTLGADLVIHSATKYIAGHNDVSWYTETHLLSIKVCVCTN